MAFEIMSYACFAPVPTARLMQRRCRADRTKYQGPYDVDCVAIDQEMMAVAREGEIKAVECMWPEPASYVPVDKVAFFTRVAD
jgi:hypothetical protein